MEQKGELQTETALNSPCKLTSDHFYSSFHPNKSHIQVQSTRASTFRLSETQQQIYTHDLIREVMEASKNRSLHHDINRIDQEVELYAKPLKIDKNEFKFNCIPANNSMYASSCHQKIKQIKRGLSQSRSTQPSPKTSQVNTKAPKNRPLSAASRVNTKNPKVSVAGLVSYRFDSVNARKSLGTSKLNHQQLMVDQLIAASKKQYCGMERGDRILAKTSNRRFSKQQKNQQAMMKDLLSETDTYLKSIRDNSEQNTLIYNEKAKKLNFIKQYMAQEKTDYDTASHIVNEIQIADKPKANVKKPAPPAVDPNDQMHLIGRRMPAQRRPLFVNHFQFIE